MIGRGQNAGGDEAVTQLKTTFAEALVARGLYEAEVAPGSFAPFAIDKLNLHRFRFRGRLAFEFLPGGNHPDLVVTNSPHPPLLVGEVKGRKDLANAWESWMPQIAAHLREWARTYPSALRVVFGTVFTEGMVEGRSTRTTGRDSLRELHAAGLLSGVFNLSKLVARDDASVAAFTDLIALLDRVAADG